MSNFYKFAQLISFLYFRFFHRFQVYGLENIPKDGSFILASNHQSYFDPPALGCKLPRNLHYFARDSLFFWPLGSLIRNLNSIPVNRTQLDFSTLKTVLKIIKSGEPILVFPEGTRSEDEEIGTGKKGIGLILSKSNTLVVPARVIGGSQILGKGMLIPRIGKKLQIYYGKPVKIKDLEGDGNGQDRYQQISANILKIIGHLGPNTQLNPHLG